MFGVLHYNKDVPAKTSFVELPEKDSSESRPRSQAALGCDQCQSRKLKCSEERPKCRRCQVTSSVCSYRSLPLSSKRRLSAHDVEEPPRTSSKRIAIHKDDTLRPSSPKQPHSTNLGQPMPFYNPRDEMWWSATLLEPEIVGDVPDWDGVQENLHNMNSVQRDYEDTSLMTISLPELEHAASNNESTGGDVTSGSSTEKSQEKETNCKCISLLANSLERINGGNANDVEDGDRLDHLLMHLHDGIETCKKVKQCRSCSVYTTNSMVVVTIIHQLAVIAQTLSMQLIQCERAANASGSNTEIPQLSHADIRIGEFKIKATSLHLKFMFPIAGLYLRDLQQLMEHLKEDMRKGTKIFKMLIAAAEVVQNANRSLRR